MSKNETYPNDSNQEDQSGWLSKNKYVLDAAVRFVIVAMVFYIEWHLLRALNHVKISESFGLLAAIVIVAFLLVLSLTLFKGSLEQDVQELKEKVPKLETDVNRLNDEHVKNLNDKVQSLDTDVKKLKAENDEKLKKENLELKDEVKKLKTETHELKAKFEKSEE